MNKFYSTIEYICLPISKFICPKLLQTARFRNLVQVIVSWRHNARADDITETSLSPNTFRGIAGEHGAAEARKIPGTGAKDVEKVWPKSKRCKESVAEQCRMRCVLDRITAGAG